MQAQIFATHYAISALASLCAVLFKITNSPGLPCLQLKRAFYFVHCMKQENLWFIKDRPLQAEVIQLWALTISDGITWNRNSPTPKSMMKSHEGKNTPFFPSF